MIELGRLLALRAVATYGTVTAAAGALHCTPSAVSQHLAKLERETGARLVEKDGRRLRLTEAGRVLVEHAGRVLAAVEEAEAALAAHHETVSGRLTIASFPTACRGLMPNALRRLATLLLALSVTFVGLLAKPHAAACCVVRQVQAHQCCKASAQLRTSDCCSGNHQLTNRVVHTQAAPQTSLPVALVGPMTDGPLAAVDSVLTVPLSRGLAPPGSLTDS